MTPSLLLLLLIAIACAASAHLLWGERWLHLLVYLAAAALGAGMIGLLGLGLPLDTPRPAGVPVIEAVLGAWVMLFIASRIRL